MLCTQCEPIKLLKNSPEVVCYYPNANYLAEQGERGCPTCFVLQDRCWPLLTDRRIPDSLGHDRLKIRWTIQDKKLMPWIHYLVGSGDGIMDIVNASNKDLLRNGRWLGTSIHQVPSSDECMRLAKKWIKTCVKDHRRCPKSLHVSLPKRLVDVGSPSREPFLKLCHDIKGRYAALSYCWGKTETLKTQRRNVEAHTKQIPMLGLPRSLQNAVTITRMLGIQYLWIDALCIIQDDVADWEEQSAAMCDIYRHSYVTISATSAQDSETSWLENRENGFAPVKLWETEQFFPRESKTAVYLIPQVKPWDYNIDKAPISARAWTLQERILSSRVLHFGAHQMVLECETCTVSEAGNDKEFFGPLYGESATYTSRHSRNMGHRTPFQFKRILADDKFALSIDINIPQPSSDPAEGKAKDRMLLCWYELLTEYTKRSLTKEEDKLVALLGIIDLIRGKITDEIVAGLWRTDIPRGLCWIILDNAHSRRPSTPRAPSWSWLAIDGILKFADKLMCDSSSEISEYETIQTGVGTCTGSLVLKSELQTFQTLVELQNWAKEIHATIFMDIPRSLEESQHSYTIAYIATLWRKKAMPDDIVKEYDSFYLILALSDVEGIYQRIGIARSNWLWSEPAFPDARTFQMIRII